MFEIREKTNEQLDTLQHGMNLFHEALSGGKKAYHVTRENGEDYDIVYTKNFDYVLPAMPEAYRHLVIYWDFLTYDEEDTAHIVLDQFQNRKKAVFLETNEYTIVIGRILLRDRKDMDLYYQDPRILQNICMWAERFRRIRRKCFLLPPPSATVIKIQPGIS